LVAIGALPAFNTWGIEELRVTLSFMPANALDRYKSPSRPTCLTPTMFAGAVTNIYARVFPRIAACFRIGCSTLWCTRPC
jgi:hypothetical protein